jgi:uncharacterized Zn finger protein
MRVGYFKDWVRHIRKAEDDKISAYPKSANGPDHQVWITTSSKLSPEGFGVPAYTVVYHANAYEQFISCNCPAGRHDLKCKHAARVLGVVAQQGMTEALKEVEA